MDENKIISVILQGVDAISKPVKDAAKSVDQSVEKIKSSLKRGTEDNKKYEDSWFRLNNEVKDARKEFGETADVLQQMSETLRGMQKETTKASKGFREFLNDRRSRRDEGTKIIQARTAALRELNKETKKRLGIVQSIAGEADGSRTIRGAGGKILPGKGNLVGDKVLVNQAREVEKINNNITTSLSQGYRIAKNTQASIDKALGATKQIRKNKLEELDIEFRKNKLKLSADQDRQRAADVEVVHEKQIASGLLEVRKDLLRQLKAARAEDDLVKQQEIEDEYSYITRQLDSIEKVESARRTRTFQKKREDLRKIYDQDKANIKSLSTEDAKRIIEEFQLRRKEALRSGTRRDRVVKTVGFGVGDFFGGIARGKSEVRDLDKDLEKLSSKFGRLGFAIGGAFKDISSFVNLRWLFITSAIILLINVLTQLVVVLVSVAASAILAGAALGAALTAGITQAIPVVGLLVGAFHSFQNVLKAVQLQDKANVKGSNDAKEAADKRTQSIQRLADAHYAVKQSILSVKDANYNLAQSHYRVGEAEKDRMQAAKDLVEARKQAAKDIVDANLQEKDSALALEEAELGVLKAKEKLRQEEEKNRKGATDIAQAKAAVKEATDRLKIAQTEGDNPEVVRATQQLSLAEQNLSSIQDNIANTKTDLKDAQLDVKRAEINRQQAASRKKQDAQDAAKLRKDGISQSKVVLAAEKQLVTATKSIADAQRDVAQAQRQVADSIHSLAISRREEGDAKKALADKTNLQSAAQKNLNEAVAQFSPAEKKLYQSLLRVKNAYKKAFTGTKGKDGILGPIIGAFATIADAITELLTDPKILKALGGLADAIGVGFQKFAKLLTSKGFKEDLLFFIKEGTDNLPKVFNILFDIFNLIRSIGREGAPIFKKLLGGLGGLTSRATNFVTGKSGAESPIPRYPKQQQTNLGAFLGKASQHLDAWLKLGKAITTVIAAITNIAAPTGKSLIESMTESLNSLTAYIKANPVEAKKFFNDVADGFRALAKALLGLIILFGKASKDQNIQNFALFLVKVIVPGLYLMITVVGLFAGALDSLTKIPILGSFIAFAVQIAVAEKALNKLFPVTQGLTDLIRKGLKKSFEGLFLILKNPQNALVAAKEQLQLIGTAATNAGKKIVLMGSNWKSAGVGVVSFAKRFILLARAQGIITTLTILMRALGVSIYIALGPVGLIIAAIVAVGLAIFLLDKKFHFIRPTIEFFYKKFQDIFNWIKSHWRLVVALLTGPIGIAVLLIIKHWDKVKNLFFGFKNFLSNNFVKPVYNFLKQPFVSAYNFIVGLWKKLPGVLGAIIKRIPGLSALIKVAGKVGGFFGKVVGGAAGVVGGGAGRVSRAADAADTALGGTHKRTEVSASSIIAKDGRDRKLITKLRKKGLTDSDILDWLINHGAISKSNFKKRFGVSLTSVEGYSQGTSGVPGKGTKDTVPALLTPGEWVLNSKQIRNLASSLGVSVQQAKAKVFGTNTGTKLPSNLRPSPKNTIIGKSFSLIPQEDDNGNTVWFIELANGTFGQVTGRDAKKIQETNGKFIPGYVKRNSNGFKQKTFTAGFRPFAKGGVIPAFANGGIVPNGIKGFGSGGIMSRPATMGTSNNKTINQNFDVQTYGDSDWQAVMRLGAMRAQESY